MLKVIMETPSRDAWIIATNPRLENALTINLIPATPVSIGISMPKNKNEVLFGAPYAGGSTWLSVLVFRDPDVARSYLAALKSLSPEYREFKVFHTSMIIKYEKEAKS